MTPGRDGGRRPSGLSRRQLLTGIGGIGAVGMASGLGTGAYLSDRATLDGNALGAGGVELTVDGTVSSGVVELGVSGIEPGDAGTERFEVGVRTNPVRVWLAADCPEPGDRLADALEVDVRVDGASVSGGRGALADVQRALVGGERIDVGCLDPDDALDVAVDWRLPGDATDSLAGTDAALAFRLYAEQCRHVSEADAEGSNPFADRVCEDPEPECVPCADENGVKIGSLTLRYLGDEPADVVVAVTGGGAGGVGAGGTEVFAAEVGPNETFVVDGSASPTGDPDWIGPNIYVDDGSDTGESDGNGNGNGGNSPAGVNIHTSCSVLLGPGDVYGDFEITGGTTTDDEPLCGSEAI